MSTTRINTIIQPKTEIATPSKKIGSLFKGQLEINYIEKNSKDKPELKIIFNNINFIIPMNGRSVKHFFKSIGYFINDTKHSKKRGEIPHDIIFTVSGLNNVCETVNALLIHLKTYPEPDQQLEKELIRILNSTVEQKNKIYSERKKTLPPSRKNTSQYVDAFDQDDVNKSAHAVIKQRTPKNKYVYNKPQVSAINELESFNSEIFKLLLGSKRVGKVRPVYNSENIRIGSVSREVDGFITIKSIRSKSNILELKEVLISGGLGKVEVANHVYAENDPHFGNVALNCDGNVCRIDFDQALFPITARYIKKDFNKIRGLFPVHQDDITELPWKIHTQPFNSTMKSFEKMPRILDSIKNDERFINDKWYTYLKFLLINDDMYKARLDYCISSNKRKEEVLNFLHLRREEFEAELLKIPEFRNWVINNPLVIDTIMQEFNELNQTYQSPKKQTLLINLKAIKNDYQKLSFKIIDEEYYQSAANKSYPDSYTNLWKNQSLNENLKSIFNDYINPTWSNFFTGHWGRGNQKLAQSIIEWLDQNPSCRQPEIKLMLMNLITECRSNKTINLEGSFFRRLQFGFKKVIESNQTPEHLHAPASSTLK